jgi:hypothetical protein
MHPEALRRYVGRLQADEGRRENLPSSEERGGDQGTPEGRRASRAAPSAVALSRYRRRRSPARRRARERTTTGRPLAHRDCAEPQRR